MKKAHSFHIPVMGIGFTVDTPIKISKFGMDSVISLVDDILLEKLRKMYCEKYQIHYQEISNKIDDFRAKRITSYLNMMQDIAQQKFDELKDITEDRRNELKDYFNLLPDSSELKGEFDKLTSKYFNIEEVKTWLQENLSMGSIDVNIMTKVDKDNYRQGEKLPVEYNDAHAALRGYANSNLSSSLILSAGMNPRLYSYMEGFKDFYPDAVGEIKKKIVLKVSDFKSALIQGKFLAKKGLWVSEYRIESGLNCGGHAFATEGFLLGPILAEFRDKRDELTKSVKEVLMQALRDKKFIIPKKELEVKVTAQGGVGTAEEHDFLIDHFKVDSVGWGTPFLLVPEATTIDELTVDQLVKAKEKDLFLSNISPLGIPFNSLRGNTKDEEKLNLIKLGRPGSKCPKQFAALNNEFSDKTMCTASRKYQDLKIKELKTENLSAKDYQKRYDQIVDKSCTCVGLGTSALLVHKLDTRIEGEGVSVCPGPNMAYFNQRMSLKEMTDHIYGKTNMIDRQDRPNMFLKELNIYLDYLKDKMEETKTSMTKKQEKYIKSFQSNMDEGIQYYQKMFGEVKGKFENKKTEIMKDLENYRLKLQQLTK